MTITHFNVGSSKETRETSRLMNPWIVLLITIAVRLAASVGYEVFVRASTEPLVFYPPRQITLSSILPQSELAPRTLAYHAASGERTLPQLLLRFSIISAPLDAAVWREVAFLRSHFADAGIPDYLLSVAPWYARYLPPFLACRPWPVLWLSLCDGLTAFLMAGWPACTPALLYAGFVLNPLMLLPTVCESIMSLEWLLLAIAMKGCRHRRKSMWMFLLAVLASVALGSSFLGVLVMLLYPVGTRSCRLARGSGVALCLLVGIYALLYHFYTKEVFKRSATFAPPDHSTMWYVRQSVLPFLERCLEVTHVMLPALITLPTAMAIPPFATAETSSSKHIPLVSDIKGFLVSFAIAISVLHRSSLTLPFCCFVVLIMYSNRTATGAAAPTGVRGDHSAEKKPFGLSFGGKLNMFLPVYTFLITVPAVWGLYVTYGIWEALNMNWMFFFNILFLLGCVSYLAIWMDAVISEVIDRETSEKSEAI